jgi:exodeoxyribonuclease VII small subunit
MPDPAGRPLESPQDATGVALSPAGAEQAVAPAASVTLSFEAALSELEAIVVRMESGELPLEQSLLAYKRGAELLQHCQSALKDAQQQVKILEAGLLQDFSGGTEQE